MSCHCDELCSERGTSPWAFVPLMGTLVDVSLDGYDLDAWIC